MKGADPRITKDQRIDGHRQPYATEVTAMMGSYH